MEDGGGVEKQGAASKLRAFYMVPERMHEFSVLTVGCKDWMTTIMGMLGKIPITVVDIPLEAAGEQAAKMLLKLCEGKSLPPEERVIQVPLGTNG